MTISEVRLYFHKLFFIQLSLEYNLVKCIEQTPAEAEV